MKETLVTLWVAGMLALLPKGVQSEVLSKTEDAKKDLFEVMAKGQTSQEKKSKIISFNDAKNLYRQHQFFEAIMKHKEIQKLVGKYWQEKIEKIINRIMSNKSTMDAFDYTEQKADFWFAISLFALIMSPIIVEIATSSANWRDYEKSNEWDGKCTGWRNNPFDLDEVEIHAIDREETKNALENIKQKFVKVDNNVEMFGVEWRNIHIDIPAKWSFEWLKFDFFVSKYPYYRRDKFENHASLRNKSYSMSEVWKLLDALNRYLKELWIITDWDMNYEKDLKHCSRCEAWDCFRYITGLDWRYWLKDRNKFSKKGLTYWYCGPFGCCFDKEYKEDGLAGLFLKLSDQK